MRGKKKFEYDKAYLKMDKNVKEIRKNYEELKEVSSEINTGNYGVTANQEDLLVFITLFHKEFNIFPTIREMMSGQINGNQVIKKRKYSNGISRMLLALEQRGRIRRLKGYTRAIELL